MWQFTRTDWLQKCQQKKIIFDTKTFCNFYLILIADPCYNYQNLSDANRKSSYSTPRFGPSLCDNLLPLWYRFVGAAGTKMPTTRVPAYRCGTDFSGWLDDAHPTVEDGEVQKKVCFSNRGQGCRYTKKIFVKNCSSYFMYKFFSPPGCPSRYCGTDWKRSKKSRKKRIHKLILRYTYPRLFTKTSFYYNHLVNFTHWCCLLQ